MFQVHPLLRPRSAGGYRVDVLDIAGRRLLKCKGIVAILSAVGLQDIHHSGYDVFICEGRHNKVPQTGWLW